MSLTGGADASSSSIGSADGGLSSLTGSDDAQGSGGALGPSFDAAVRDGHTATEKPAETPPSVEAKAETAFARAEARRVGIDGIQLARAEIRDTPKGSVIDIKPEDDLIRGVPDVTIPNTVGAEGFGRDMWQHDYLVVTPAPADLRGPEALTAINKALRANATPGDDKPATPEGARNDVGDITLFDGDDNFVKTFVVDAFSPKASATSPARSDIVVNYTIKDEHILDEGFVMRYAVMGADGGIDLVTYGEGNATLQVEGLEGIWGGQVDRVWTENAQEIFGDARRLMRK
ncbi:MAG: hypothetical protein OEU92_06365 [Alphaproteobacteria bacterium]|nr:hypothetical protein [Alphaproteobacteria bacterium]